MADFEILLSSNDVIYDEILQSIDTPLCIRVNGQYFPDEQWTDLSYSVLSMWTEELSRNINKSKSTFTLSFEDGPFWINVQQSRDILLLSGINGRFKNNLAFEADLTVAEFLSELLHAFERLKCIVSTTKEIRDDRNRQNELDNISHYTGVIEKLIYCFGSSA